MMQKPIITLCTIAGITALSACGQDFYQEAGASLDEGNFGNPTMNNIQLQNGEKSYTESLARRFAEEVNSTITFAFDSTVLDQNARATLDKQAHWIRQFPEVRFKVYGHTDKVGSPSYNKSLGKRRADAVVRYLGTRGISRARLEAVVSFGETQPLIVTDGRERRNRRTVTEVSGFVERHPTVLNGKYAEVIWREYVASATEKSATESGTGGD